MTSGALSFFSLVRISSAYGSCVGSALSHCFTCQEHLQQWYDDGHEEHRVAPVGVVAEQRRHDERGHVDREVGEVVEGLQLEQAAEVPDQVQLAVPGNVIALFFMARKKRVRRT